MSFKEFWPLYLKDHSHPTSRKLHFIGTSLAILLFAASIVKLSGLLLFAAILVGYAFAWVGHFFIEKNKPATFKHPWLSLMGDFKMWYLMLTRKI